MLRLSTRKTKSRDNLRESNLASTFKLINCNNNLTGMPSRYKTYLSHINHQSIS